MADDLDFTPTAWTMNWTQSLMFSASLIWNVWSSLDWALNHITARSHARLRDSSGQLTYRVRAGKVLFIATLKLWHIVENLTGPYPMSVLEASLRIFLHPLCVCCVLSGEALTVSMSESRNDSDYYQSVEPLKEIDSRIYNEKEIGQVGSLGQL